MLVCHNEPVKKLVSTDVVYDSIDAVMIMIIQVMDVQAPALATIVYLLGLDPVTTDCTELTNTIMANKMFANIPIYVLVQPVRLRQNEAWPAWDSLDRVNAVTIKCAGHMTKHGLLACKKLFKSPKL